MRFSTCRTVLCALIAAALAGAAGAQANLAKPATLPRVAAAPAAPTTFGTTQTSYRVVIASQLSPFTSAVTYDDLGNGSNRHSRYATGSPGAFIGDLDLPSGALLTSFELDSCDSNTTDSHVVGILGVCDTLGLNCAAIGAQIQTVSDTVEPCKAIVQDLTGLNYTVNNVTNNYIVEVLTNSLDNTNSFSAARIGYKLQVSPAPGSATFPDVPTSDFGFQYIEALVASGVTGGCGGGLYCPDAFVTRRQMAIFIAKALGLQWP